MKMRACVHDHLIRTTPRARTNGLCNFRKVVEGPQHWATGKYKCMGSVDLPSSGHPPCPSRIGSLRQRLASWSCVRCGPSCSGSEADCALVESELFTCLPGALVVVVVVAVAVLLLLLLLFLFAHRSIRSVRVPSTTGLNGPAGPAQTDGTLAQARRSRPRKNSGSAPGKYDNQAGSSLRCFFFMRAAPW